MAIGGGITEAACVSIVDGKLVTVFSKYPKNQTLGIEEAIAQLRGGGGGYVAASMVAALRKKLVDEAIIEPELVKAYQCQRAATYVKIEIVNVARDQCVDPLDAVPLIREGFPAVILERDLAQMIDLLRDVVNQSRVEVPV